MNWLSTLDLESLLLRERERGGWRRALIACWMRYWVFQRLRNHFGEFKRIEDISSWWSGGKSFLDFAATNYRFWLIRQRQREGGTKFDAFSECWKYLRYVLNLYWIPKFPLRDSFHRSNRCRNLMFVGGLWSRPLEEIRMMMGKTKEVRNLLVGRVIRLTM